MADEHLISLQPGTIIAAKYEVVKCLGAGSMGLVYACRHRELSGHLVAIKVLFPEVAQDKVAAARFRNEIFASYGVSHPNVVRAYEYLRDGDLVAYTMEYVGGGDLAELLGRPNFQMPIADAIRLLSQMCAGVQAIHDAGIVHRDLKPENILLTKEGTVKIADFGIAKAGHGPKLTEHGGVVGTIDYVSPEYMLNSQVDWRSDIYALGILGFEMITGESPFRGDSVYATMTKRLKTDPPAPSTLRPECPAELDRIILHAMARDPEQRYQTAAEMFYELQALMPERPLSSGALLEVSRSNSRAFQAPQKVTPPVDEAAGSKPRSGMLDHAAHAAPPAHGMQAAKSSPMDSRIAKAGGALPDETLFAPGESVVNSFGAQPVRGNELDPPTLRDQLEGPPTAADHTLMFQMDGTQVLNPEIAKYANQFKDQEEEDAATIQPPVRMERMLSYTDIASSPYPAASSGMPVNVNGGDLNESRIRRLARQQAEAERSGVWLEWVAYLLAILIGIGVGFAFLRIFVPDLFGRKPVSQISQLLERTTESASGADRSVESPGGGRVTRRG